MSKFKVGDKVTANYGDYVENGIVTKVVRIPGTSPDYYVSFGGKDFDIFSESELEANPNG